VKHALADDVLGLVVVVVVVVMAATHARRRRRRHDDRRWRRKRRAGEAFWLLNRPPLSKRRSPAPSGARTRCGQELGERSIDASGDPNWRARRAKRLTGRAQVLTKGDG
jgi:hypothetical protein